MQDGEWSNILDQRTTSCSRQSFLQSRMKYAPENLHNHQVFKFLWLKGPRSHFEKLSPHSRFCLVEHCMTSQRLVQLRKRLVKLFRRWSLFPSKISLCSFSFSWFVPCLEHLPTTFPHHQHHSSKQIYRALVVPAFLKKGSCFTSLFAVFLALSAETIWL